MKKLIAVLGLAICAASHAKVVVLDCNGTEYGLPISPSKLSYQLTIDDELNIITSMTDALARGCFPTQYIKSTKCECQVEKQEISCDSSFIGGKEGETRGNSLFTIDRYTGKMTLVWQFSVKGDQTRKAESYGASGILQCEAITTPKF